MGRMLHPEKVAEFHEEAVAGPAQVLEREGLCFGHGASVPGEEDSAGGRLPGEENVETEAVGPLLERGEIEAGAVAADVDRPLRPRVVPQGVLKLGVILCDDAPEDRAGRLVLELQAGN